MKISDICNTTGLTQNTIRYYIEMGLIIPKKKGSHHYFDDEILSEIQWIQSLKDKKFSLKEIHKILSLKRVSNWVETEDISDYIAILEEQKISLEKEIKSTQKIITSIDKEIYDFKKNTMVNENISGLPLRSLELFCCPICQNNLSISKADMNHKYIFNGIMTCKCGYNLDIDNGIVKTNSVNSSQFDRPDLTRELYKDVPPEVITLIKKSYNWMIDALDNFSPKPKIILESHINAYFFLYNHYSALDPNNLYIIVDKFPETLEMYKNRIDKLNLDLSILYIANNDFNLPIKDDSVDLFIDYFGSNEHSIYNNNFLIESVSKHLKASGHILGTYFYFDENAQSFEKLKEEYPENYHYNFNIDKFTRSLYANNYQIDDYSKVGYTSNSGNNLAFSFHVDDEKMYLYSFNGSKQDL